MKRILALVLVVIMTLALLAGCQKNGKKSNAGTSSSNSKSEKYNKPEDAVTDFTQKLASGDAEGAFKCSAYDMEYYINAILDSDDAYKEAFKEEYGTTNYRKIIKKTGEKLKESLEEEYGDNYKIEVKIKDVDYLSKSKMKDKIDEIDKTISYLEKWYDGFDAEKYLDTDKITKMCKVKAKIKISGDDKSDSETVELYCVKISGKWKLEAFSVPGMSNMVSMVESYYDYYDDEYDSDYDEYGYDDYYDY